MNFKDKKKRFSQGTVVNALEWKATAASPGKGSLVGHSKLFFPFIKHVVLKMIEWIRILCTHDYVIKDNYVNDSK